MVSTVISGLTSRNLLLSKLSDVVYGDGPGGLNLTLSSGVTLTPLYTSTDLMPQSGEGGFFAAVYQLPGTDKLVIAFRGTDGWADTSTGLALKNGTWDPQFDNAIDFVARIAAELKIPVDEAKSSFIATGHSLGGALAQVVGRLYGMDGAAFDPAGGERQTQLSQFLQAGERVRVAPDANQIPNTFRNYVVDGSAVSSQTGPHVGDVETIPQLSYPGLTDLLKSAGLAALTNNPLVMVLGLGITDQFSYKHSIGQIAETLDRLATMENDPFINVNGTEIRINKLVDGSGWQLTDQAGTNFGTFQTVDGNIRLTTADNQQLQISSNGIVSYTPPESNGAQILGQAINQYGGTLIDALTMLKAIQSGQPLPIVTSGLRLTVDFTKTTDPQYYNLSGAANVGSGILSLMSLDAALKRGDGIAAVTAGAQTLSFAATAYTNFLTAQYGGDAIRAIAGGNAAAYQFANDIGQAVPYLNLVNSLAHGDGTGAAIATLQVMVTEKIITDSLLVNAIPYIGWAYTVYSLVNGLFSNNKPPEPWGGATATWSGFDTVANAYGAHGGQDTASAYMNQFIAQLDALAAREHILNPNSPIAVVANRLPSFSYRYYSGFTLTDIDPLTGVQQNVGIRYDLSGRPVGAEPGSELGAQSFAERFMRVALSRGAIAPLWEAQTAAIQTSYGDPQAGLTEEERAGRAGLLASLVTGDSQLWRPVALDLNGDGVQTTGSLKTVSFNVDDSGYLKNTAWLNNADGFLFLDRNLNGQLDASRELFSNGLLDISARGLAGLRWVDSNYDGRLDSSDPVWSQLKVWQDADGDGQTDTGETKTLSELGITSLDYAMSRFEQNGSLKQLASPDLQADTYGIKTQVVPEGIVVQNTNGQISLLTTHIDDKSLLEAGRDGVTANDARWLLAA